MAADNDALVQALHDVVRKYDDIYRCSLRLACVRGSARLARLAAPASAPDTPDTAPPVVDPPPCHATGCRPPPERAAPTAARRRGPGPGVDLHALAALLQATLEGQAAAGAIPVAGPAMSPRPAVIRTAPLHTCQVAWAGRRSGVRCVRCPACNNRPGPAARARPAASPPRVDRRPSPPLGDAPAPGRCHCRCNPAAPAEAGRRAGSPASRESRPAGPRHQPPRGYPRLHLAANGRPRALSAAPRPPSPHCPGGPCRCPCARNPEALSLAAASPDGGAAAGPARQHGPAAATASHAAADSLRPLPAAVPMQATAGPPPVSAAPAPAAPTAATAAAPDTPTAAVQALLQHMPWVLNPDLLRALGGPAPVMPPAAASASSVDYLLGSEEEDGEEDAEEPSDEDHLLASPPPPPATPPAASASATAAYIAKLERLTALQWQQYQLLRRSGPAPHYHGTPPHGAPEVGLDDGVRRRGPPADFDIVREDAIVFTAEGLGGMAPATAAAAPAVPAVGFFDPPPPRPPAPARLQEDDLAYWRAVDSRSPDFMKSKVLQWLRGS